MTLRAIHRLATFVVVAFTLYLGVTGSLIQLIDFRSIITQAPPLDPNLMAMREAFDGPPDYQVIMPADYLAAPLPAGADLPAMFGKTVTGARASLGGASLRFVELRVDGGVPVGQVQVAKTTYRFDPATGAPLAMPPANPLNYVHPPSDRNTVKELHRMTTFGDRALWINIGVSIGLATLIVTGTIVYGKMLAGRWRLGRKGLFWNAGGWWRSIHRAVSVLAALFLVVVSLSGAWLAVESLCLALYREGHPPRYDAASPVADAALPAMLRTTLDAAAKADPDGGLRVVRLRWYGGMPQGVVVTAEPTARQLVFDARTGRRVSETEPGYPPTGFPFGWQAHQTAKSIHRGSYFGLTGRVMDLLAGLSMIYLSVSGVVMYVELWKRRRKAGKTAVVWM